MKKKPYTPKLLLPTSQNLGKLVLNGAEATDKIENLIVAVGRKNQCCERFPKVTCLLVLARIAVMSSSVLLNEINPNGSKLRKSPLKRILKDLYS